MSMTSATVPSASHNALFEPAKIGRYTVRNRMVMAPMSRYRARPDGTVPAMTAEYYRQRATAGLIVAESTRINDWSGGVNAPGIHTPEQVEAWRAVTDAVHAEGGLIFLQLWHAGRTGHQTQMPTGRQVSAPSAVASTTTVMTAKGMQLPPTPHALTLDEISELRVDWAAAARNALDAGFDGIEVHAAGGFLIDTFLQSHTNTRTDAYGGSLENRFRFLGEVLSDAVQIWGADRVGVKVSPTSQYNDMAAGDTAEAFEYVYDKLNAFGLAFLEVNEEMPFSTTSTQDRALLDDLQSRWRGAYFANGNYAKESGSARIEAGKATAISFGRPFLANPDLVMRYQQNAPLNQPDPGTFYGGDEHGYTDYPSLEG